MSEGQTEQLVQEQRDTFTCIAVFVFICLVAAAAHGFFEFGERLLMADYISPQRQWLKLFSLFVAPGLFCGVMWRKWGFIFGAGAGTAVRLLSSLNLGMIVPYFSRQHVRSSMALGWQQLQPLGKTLVLAAAAGVVCALIGQLISRIELSKKRWFRWLSRCGLLFLTIGMVLAGGAWVFAFMPWGGTDRPRRMVGMLQRFEHHIMNWVEGPAAAFVWAGLVLVLLCLAALVVTFARSLAVKGRQAEQAGEPGTEADARAGLPGEDEAEGGGEQEAPGVEK